MYKKNFFFLAFLSLLVIGCTNTNINTLFNIKSEKLEIKPTASIVKSDYEYLKPNELEKNFKKIDSKSKLVKLPKFDDYPKNPSSYENTQKITVIYKNNYLVRVDKKNNKIKSNGRFDYSSLIELLNRYELINVADSSITDNIDELDKQNEVSNKYYGTEIPHSSSIHYYEFEKSFNFYKLCEELRKLPFILTAYANQKVVVSSATKLSSQTINTYSGNKPNLSWYTGSETNWWWYNVEKIFHGWDYYKSNFSGITDIKNCPMPKIAVIDNGFDQSSDYGEKPMYEQGVYVNSSGQQYPGQIQPSISPFVNYTYPISNNGKAFFHGDAVASVVGNPGRIMGIAPNALIIPIRIDNSPLDPYNFLTLDGVGLDYAIDIASSKQDVDIINISILIKDGYTIQSPDLPISYIASHRAKIANAIANGKVVIICSGNTGTNIDRNNTPQIDWANMDVGEIIVGGSEFDNSVPIAKAMGWRNTNNGYGTTYSGDFPDTQNQEVFNSNRIDLIAGSKGIWTKTLDAYYQYRTDMQLDGTSFAAPQVAAAAGMVKKIALSNNLILKPKQIRDILTMSSSLGRYLGGTAPNNYDFTYREFYYLGRELDTEYSNPYREVSIRSLNLLNALVVAKNLKYYNSLVRVFNIDDAAWASINSDWTNGYIKGAEVYGNDAIYGLNNLPNNTNLTFATCNNIVLVINL